MRDKPSATKNRLDAEEKPRQKHQTPDPNRVRQRTRDLVARWGVSRMTISNWRRKGILPEPIRIGNVVFWPLEAIEAVERERSGAR